MNGDQVCVYGGAAFTLRPFMIVPFNTTTADDAEIDFNKSMSEVHVAFERYYKDSKQRFPVNDFKGLPKLPQTPVALLYKESALFLNMATCLYKDGQIGNFFKFEASSLNPHLTID